MSGRRNAMEPLSITTSAIALAGAVAKTALVLSQFSNEFRDAAEDLNAVSAELQALTAIIDPLTRRLSRRRPSTLPEGLVPQVDDTLSGCVLMVEHIAETVEKYRRNTWTRAKWVLMGKEDVQKLRQSLEAYKMSLSLGLHAVSL